MFLVKSLKFPNDNFDITNHITFASNSTRSASFRKPTPIRLLLLALEVCVNARPCWRNVPLPFWRDKLGYRVLEKWLSCWGWGVLGRVSWVEQAPYLADMERGTEGILVAQAGGEGK